MRVEPLEHGGLLVVATDSPRCPKTPTTRANSSGGSTRRSGRRSLSRDQTTEMKRGMLGYFYRERPPVR